MTDSQDPQAILERIVEAERQVRRQARDLDQLLDWLEVAERDLQATLGSWRWRLGDRLIRAVEILLGRRRPSLAMDHLVSIFAEIRFWRQTRGERSYAIACGEDDKDLELNLEDTENLERVLFVGLQDAEAVEARLGPFRHACQGALDPPVGRAGAAGVRARPAALMRRPAASRAR